MARALFHVCYLLKLKIHLHADLEFPSQGICVVINHCIWVATGIQRRIKP